jgi:hypothetical protein
MKFVPISGRNVRAMLGGPAMQALCMSPLAALAPPPTNVNPAPLIQNPYQVTASVADSSTCAPQCIVKFPTVPKAKRLVITNVSAQLGQRRSRGPIFLSCREQSISCRAAICAKVP